MYPQMECTPERHVFMGGAGICICGQMRQPVVSRTEPRKPRMWPTVVVFVVTMALVVFWTYKWHTLPCSSFKTNPVLRGGYAPARCVK